MNAPIELAIYEHKAALIGEQPSTVARDARLLAKAIEREWEMYGADYLTVGLDIYNIEAEACGAQINWEVGNACPEIAAPLYTLDQLPAFFPKPDVRRDGRFPLIVEAAQSIDKAVRDRAQIRVGVSGPVSIASKLVPMSDLLSGLILNPPAVRRLLSFCASLTIDWVSHLGDCGLHAIVFDSAASPPLFGPVMYREIVAPHHRAIMSTLQSAGQEQRPLIMGGDTSSMIADLVETGANVVICDFGADQGAFHRAIQPFPDLVVRRNANPADLLASTRRARQAAERIKQDLRALHNPVAGSGILAYDTPPENVRAFLAELRS